MLDRHPHAESVSSSSKGNNCHGGGPRGNYRGYADAGTRNKRGWSRWKKEKDDGSEFPVEGRCEFEISIKTVLLWGKQRKWEN